MRGDGDDEGDGEKFLIENLDPYFGVVFFIGHPKSAKNSTEM